VLLFCWHAYAARASTGPQFVAMNYLVHSVMYYYYFAVALRVWPSFLSPMIITVLQLTQMALGGGICAGAAALLPRLQRRLHPGLQFHWVSLGAPVGQNVCEYRSRGPTRSPSVDTQRWRQRLPTAYGWRSAVAFAEAPACGRWVRWVHTFWSGG